MLRLIYSIVFIFTIVVPSIRYVFIRQVFQVKIHNIRFYMLLVINYYVEFWELKHYPPETTGIISKMLTQD